MTQKCGRKVEIRVFESAAILSEVGASIALGPNGLRTLRALDIRLDDAGFKNPSGRDHTCAQRSLDAR